MRWFEYSENPVAIKSIFGENVSSPEDMRIKEISLSHDGPRINIKLDLSDYPAQPPLKWNAENCNTVSLELLFVEVSNLKFTNWSINNVSSLSILKNDNHLIIDFSEICSFRSKWMYINSITGYENK